MTTESNESVDTTVEAPVKRGRGRPKGSKNKPKAPKAAVVGTAVVTETKTSQPSSQAFVATE